MKNTISTLILLMVSVIHTSLWSNTCFKGGNGVLLATAPVSSFSVATATICAGATILLIDNSLNNPTTWNWQTPGAVTSSASVNNPTLIYNSAGSYTIYLTASNASGTGNTYTLAIFVNPNPTISVTSSSAQICSGKSATLTAAGAFTYSWLTSSSSTIITTSTNAITPPLSNTYTVVGTSSAGCSTNGTVAVAVLPLPTVVIAPTVTNMCVHDCKTLTATGANTYTWSSGSNSLAIVHNPPQAGTVSLSVSGTNSLGCVSLSATITIAAFYCVADSLNNSLRRTICSPGAVGELEALAHISIQPNPGNGTYFISNLPEAELISLQVFDELGRELYNKQVTAQEIREIHLNNLSNGLYLLRIHTSMHSRQIRLLKE